MNRRVPILLLIALSLGGIGYLLLRRPAPPAKPQTIPAAISISETPPPKAPEPSSTPSTPPAAPQKLTPELEIELVSMTLEDFRRSLGENPVGSNAEITASLLGDNSKNIKLPLPNGAKKNDQGELCDRWGTPYFFHQQSKTETQIRSAGPDRKMWTNDDIEWK